MGYVAGLSLEDRLALSDLVHRHAALVDAMDVDAVADLYAEDAVLVVPEPPRTLAPAVERRGRDGARETVAALSHAARTVHEVVGEVYDAGEEPDAAHGRIAGIAHHLVVRDGDTVDLVWRLRYADDYRRTPEGWRIVRRAVTIDAVEVRTVEAVRR